MEDNMKQLGYYYSESLKTVIIGYLVEHKYHEQLHGMVIGHTISIPHWGHTFRVGYKYTQWSEGFVYVGRLTTFTTLEGYLSFLKDATYEQIQAYFKIKQAVLERHCSQIIHSKGVRHRLTFNPKLLSLT